MEYPPKNLHLEIDVSKLNQNDIDWMKIHCRDRLIEIIPEIKKYNKNLENYKMKIQKVTPPKIMKKVKKSTRKEKEIKNEN